MPLEAQGESYLLEWWLPLPAEPAEWTGRWRRTSDAAEAREIASAAIRSGAAEGAVLITARVGGEKVVADADRVAAWRPGLERLPRATAEVRALPPPGRDDVECQTLVDCRDALVAAHSAGLVARSVVTVILEIIQQAFSGTGPAIDLAAVVELDPSTPSVSRAP